MQGKEVFLKSNSRICYILIFIIFLISNSAKSSNNKLTELVNYLHDLNDFTASFIQNNNEELSEGKISINNDRVRVDYSTPVKILIVLSKTKAMYYNHDLDEIEFFDPRNTPAWFFFDVFNNKNFFDNTILLEKNNNLVLEKEGVHDEQNFVINIYFEDKPIVIRKIKLEFEDTSIVLSIFNHNYNATFDRRFFKLINPSFFN